MTGHNPVLFDTSAATANVGDEIIMESVRQELEQTVKSEFWVRLSTHDYMGSIGRRWVRNANICIVGGTNLLASQYWKFRQWKITPLDALFLRGKVVLMGVGWWQYQGRPDILTRLLYRIILSHEAGVFHSVRDKYTLNKLRSIGITNVLNTCCPTMWRLDEEHCHKIPTMRGKGVVMTLTDYNKNPDLDRVLFQELSTRYTEVIVWPQGSGDRDYMMALGLPNVIDPGLVALDQVLSKPNIDYVGTRLHAGIRALRHGCRSLILAVDNRATEISKDTGLWVVPREDVPALVNALDAEKEIKIRLPFAIIQKWKSSIAAFILRRGDTALP